MVEELKLAVKVDDDIIEQSLLKQFNNAEKLADKVVFTFKNVNLDNKEIEKQFKDMQKLAGKNPIELPIDTDKSLKMLQALGDEFTRIISIAKGLDGIKTDFGTKNKTEAYNQLKQMADVFKKFYGNEEAMHSKAGTDAAYAYYKAYEEALKKGVAQSRLESVTVDVDVDPDSFYNANRLSSDRIKDFVSFKKYGGDITDLSAEILSLEGKLLDFADAYTRVKANLGDAPITPDIIRNIEYYVELLDKARYLESFGDDSDKDTISSHRDSAQFWLDNALFNAKIQNEEYTASLKEVREEKEKTDEVIVHSSTSTVDDSKFDELKADVTEIREELNGVKEKISAIDSEGFEHVREDVEKAVESVKELNSELTEVKSKLDSTSTSSVETNISSGNKDSITGIRSYWGKYGTSNSENYLNNKSDVTYNQIIKQIIEQENLAKGIMKQVSKFIDPSNLLQDIDTDYFKAINLELEKLGYHLDEIKINERDHIASAKILPIDDKALTNAEEMLDILKGIKASPIKDTFQGDTKTSAESSTPAIKDEAKAMEQVAESAEKASKAKNEFSDANERVDKGAKKSSDSIKDESAHLDKISDMVTNYRKSLKDLSTIPDGNHRFASFESQLNDLNIAITELENHQTSLKNKDFVSEDDIVKTNTLSNNITTLIETIKKIPKSERGFADLGVSKMAEKINSILKENPRLSRRAKEEIRAYYKELTTGNPTKPLNEIYDAVNRIIQKEREAGRAGKGFLDIFNNKLLYEGAGKLAGYFLGFTDFIRYGQEGIQTIRELDTALTEMRKVSDETVSSLERFQGISFDLADGVGTTAKQIQNSTADYMRLGESLDEATESARVANILLNVSEFDNIDDATSSLVSMGQAYKDLDKIEIVDKLNEVGNNYAISTDELAVAMQKSAATLSLMGNSIDETASMITTANSVLQDADTVSAGLRTISLRIVGKHTMPKHIEIYGCYKYAS